MSQPPTAKHLEASRTVAQKSLANDPDGTIIAADNSRPFILTLSKIATRSSFEPQLKFVNITMILTNDANYQVKALVDSGCAKTAMSYKLFKTLLEIDHSLVITTSNVKIQTCDGTVRKTEGFLQISIFLDKLSKYHSK